jgi:hypothetical protein
MKIISLASSVAGPACAIATSIKKHFYNNNCQTNIFDYLEITLSSINKILSEKELSFNFKIEPNHVEHSSVYFIDYDKIISHHDLILNYTDENINNLKEKYERRLERLLNDIKNEDIIYFIRFGEENENDIHNFISIIKTLNSSLKIKFIHLKYDENNINECNTDNYILINFFNYLEDKVYSEDLFFKTLEFNWNVIHNIIYKL